MAFRPHGRASVDPTNPRAFGKCDRCQFWYNRIDLRWQYDYRGRNLQNLRLLVCETCYDEPQEQLRPKVIPPDPLPIMDARVENFSIDEIDYRIDMLGNPRITMDGNYRVLLGNFDLGVFLQLPPVTPLTYDWSTDWNSPDWNAYV